MTCVMVYLLKFAEAQAAAVDPAPRLEIYPLLFASRKPGETIGEHAVAVLDQMALFTRVAALVEGVRLGAKRAIAAAATTDAAIAAFDAVQWPEDV